MGTLAASCLFPNSQTLKVCTPIETFWRQKAFSVELTLTLTLSQVSTSSTTKGRGNLINETDFLAENDKITWFFSPLPLGAPAGMIRSWGRCPEHVER